MDIQKPRYFKTPDAFRKWLERYHESKDELLVGYQVDPYQLLNNALFDVEYSEMVIVTDIDFYSMCEHHMLPFYGRAHVAYLPTDKVIGLSKIPRLVEMYARRLQVQERMTEQIAKLLQEAPGGLHILVRDLKVGVNADGIVKCTHAKLLSMFACRMKVQLFL